MAKESYIRAPKKIATAIFYATAMGICEIFWGGMGQRPVLCKMTKESYLICSLYWLAPVIWKSFCGVILKEELPLVPKILKKKEF